MHPPGFFEKDVRLSQQTTLAVGGPARWFARCSSVGQVQTALAFAAAESLPIFVLGGGSNVLVADRGFDGVVIQCALDSVEPNGALWTVGAGVIWDALVAQTVERGWSGLECLSGIPGWVGASPIQNIGAYGQEVGAVIDAVQAIDRQTGDVSWLSADTCAFGYRTSRFKQDSTRWVVVAVRYALRDDGVPTLKYAELARQVGEGPTLAKVRAAVLKLRRGKSMVYDPADPNHRSAGSFFLNPIVSAKALAKISARVHAAGFEGMPQWPVAEGIKLSAAWLIERSGRPRGWGDGRVGLSTRHTLAVINRGQATAAEIVAFAQEIQRHVAQRFGVHLTPEPTWLGFG